MMYGLERKIATLEIESEKKLPLKVKALLEKASFSQGELGTDIVSRLCLLSENSTHVNGIVRCIEYGRKIEGKLSNFDFKLFTKATSLTDIGKVGDLGASDSARETCVKIYAITSSELSVTRSLKEFCVQNSIMTTPEFWFQDGMSEQISRREFYNLHVLWGVGVLKQAKLQPSIIQAAARHHVVEGYGHPDFISESGQLIGVPLSTTEIMVMLIDKYDAARDRSGKTHSEAILDLRWRISKSQYASNTDMLESIEVLDSVLAD